MDIIDSSKALFLIIDMQEKLVNMLTDKTITENAVKLAKTAEILELPILITEQYPKGLGATIAEIKEALSNARFVEKTSFSAVKDDKFPNITNKHIIIFGIETHICVLQTAMDLLNKGNKVFVVQNASGSRYEEDKQAALRRLIHSGAQIVTAEMVIFELLESSKHSKFREIQSLIK